jgi:four helix bundle protein
MLVTRFEDLIAWQEDRALRQAIYRVSSSQGFYRDREMQSQVRAAALSAMTNISEGFADDSKKEFARFLGMAGRSCSEVQSLLYAALDEKFISDDKFKIHYEHARKVRALIGGLHASVRRQIAAQKSKPATRTDKSPAENQTPRKPNTPSTKSPQSSVTRQSNNTQAEKPNNLST